jgi:hypothetical protein
MFGLDIARSASLVRLRGYQLTDRGWRGRKGRTIGEKLVDPALICILETLCRHAQAPARNKTRDSKTAVPSSCEMTASSMDGGRQIHCIRDVD